MSWGVAEERVGPGKPGAGRGGPDAGDEPTLSSLRLNAFLQELRQDLCEGRRLPLREYLDRYGDIEEEVAREVLAVRLAVPGTAALHRLAHYQILEQIGRGGQGIVYRARDTRLDREVALKVLPVLESADLERWERFRREATVASKLQHSGLCPVLDADFEDGRPFLAMPWIEGETLAARIAREQALGGGRPSPEARSLLLGIMEALARAMHVAHEAGVVHRDVKPSNVIVRADGQPVLVDFGLAKHIVGSEASLTLSGDLLGTPFYLAPECVAGEEGGRQADVYALGVILYECVAGRKPFSHPGRERLLQAITHEDPPRLEALAPDAGADLIAVIETALEKNRHRRYATALALAEELERLRKREPVLARRIGRLGRLVRWVQRQPVVAGLSVATLVSLVGGLGVSLAMFSRSEDQRLRAEQALAENGPFSDLQELRQLIAESDRFVLASDQVPVMDAWIGRAWRLEQRTEGHRAARDALEARAVPVPDQEVPGAEWQRREQTLEVAHQRRRLDQELGNLEALRKDPSARQVDIEGRLRSVETARENLARSEAALRAPLELRLPSKREEVQFRALDDLVKGLDDFRQLRPGRPTRKRTQIWRQAAARVRDDSIVAHAAAWDECLARSQDAGLLGPESPLRAGPIEGLVPLGLDPHSGLEEFAHVLTGEIPSRSSAEVPIEIGPETAVVFVLLPGGLVEIGSDEVGGVVSASPPHQVRLAPFLLSKFEITQEQYLRMAWDRPSRWSLHTHADGRPESFSVNPVEGLSWHEASRVAHLFGFDLPTEAQWEYAARGPSPGSKEMPRLGLERMRFYSPQAASNIRDQIMHLPVGSGPANDFGLFDLNGNVSEWCRDEAGPYSRPVLDEEGWRESGNEGKSVRGDSFLNPDSSPPWMRNSADPRTRSDAIGFRVVLARR